MDKMEALAKVRAAAEAVDAVSSEARRQRDEAMWAARGAGASYRELGTAARMSHEQARSIISSGIWQRQGNGLALGAAALVAGIDNDWPDPMIRRLDPEAIRLLAEHGWISRHEVDFTVIEVQVRTWPRASSTSAPPERQRVEARPDGSFALAHVPSSD